MIFDGTEEQRRGNSLKKGLNFPQNSVKLKKNRQEKPDRGPVV